MIRVQVFRKDDLIGEAISKDAHCFIGTGKDSLVPVRGFKIGSRHVELSIDENGIFLKDGGGYAAVKVNGTAVLNYGPVAKTDTIEVGDYAIRVNPTPEAEQHWAREHAAKTPKLARTQPNPGAGSTLGRVSANRLEQDEGMAIRAVLHKKLIEMMDIRRVNVARMADDELRTKVQGMINDIIESDMLFAPYREQKDELIEIVLNEVVGLGPLEALLADDNITEVMVNRHNELFIERKGRLERSDISFSNDTAVLQAIERIVSPLGRRIDESSPMVDARLKDGSRVNAIIPPLAIRGPSVTIRKFAKKKLTAEDLIGYGAISAQMVQFLQVAVQMRANIVVSGGTGSGKTTLLNVLSNFIPDDERIVTVEDAAELKLNQPNLVSLEARPANIEGKGAIAIRDLVRNCLRMRPDRIIVGECRGGEALDMLQAMNTGHDGSLTTAHANSPRDCLSRLEVMVLLSGLEIPVQAIREQVASAVHLIVQQTRFSCGSRKVTFISEITGIEGSQIQMQDIFKYEQEGYDAEGRTKGRFVATGHMPDFYQDLVRRGLEVDRSIFEPPESYLKRAS